MLVTSQYILHISSNIQNMYQPVIKRHFSKINKIIKLRKECKLLFGPLVETKPQKKKRLKLEKKGKILCAKSNMANTELFWLTKNTHNKFMKIITQSRKEQLNDKDQSSVEKFSKMEVDNSTDQTTERLLHSESSQVAKKTELEFTNTTSNLSTKNSDNEVELSNSNVSNNENTATKCVSFNFERLPNIIIKNLLSFSIMGSKQDFPTQSTEILSISGKGDLKTLKFPSVTKILTQTMSPESKLALEKWKERMIKKLGQEGFEMHQKGI